MIFNIDNTPPIDELLEKERIDLIDEIKRLTNRDTFITFLLILTSSSILGGIVFSYTESYQYAGISAAIFPILGTILSLAGITKNAGFRSAANKIGELKNELIGLNPVSEESFQDITTLCKRHKLVSGYQKLVAEQNRPPVNSELAMYWEFDTSTIAKTAKGREFLKKAKDSVN
ncbi:MAG: hypothetical protein ACI9XC_000404 [Gammaproteobacteria bacterium]|jgi:hypothetical protein